MDEAGGATKQVQELKTLYDREKVDAVLGYVSSGSAAGTSDAVGAPKIAGTLALDRATADEPLDVFICFSSLAGSLGNAGQTDYSAANRFQDAVMAERRPMRRLGLRAAREIHRCLELLPTARAFSFSIRA